MERLTIRNSDGSYSQPTHTTFEKMFYKLAQFEDFMENAKNEYSIKDIIDLKTYIEDLRYLNKEHNKKILLLENRWEKLKDFVTKNFNYFKNSYGIFDDIFADDYRKVLDKIQRLENGSDANVDTK